MDGIAYWWLDEKKNSGGGEIGYSQPGAQLYEC